MLPQELDALTGHDQAVQCAAALFGLERCVRADTVVDDLELVERQRLDVHLRGRAAVHHERHIQLLKGTAVFQHHDLAADALFGRRAVDRDGIRCVDGCIFQCLGCAQNGRSLHVVAAGVAQTGQSIVLAEQADVRAALAVLPDGSERGIHTSNAALHSEAFFFQPAGQGLKCMKLLQPHFRVVEEVICHCSQGSCALLNASLQFFLQHNKHLHFGTFSLPNRRCFVHFEKIISSFWNSYV